MTEKARYACLMSLTPIELHKKLVSLLRQKETDKLKCNTRKYQNDYDVIRKNHKFLWEDEDEPTTWEENLAKRYYDKLYKEYCICDLSLYKEGKIAMRWRTEQELVTGKGQFICGNKHCSRDEDLTSWEVNFAYKEREEKKNALVKIRLCADCSSKLSYKTVKGKFKKVKRKQKSSEIDQPVMKKLKVAGEKNHEPADLDAGDNAHSKELHVDEERAIWKSVNQNVTEEKSRDDDFEEFLNHILL